MIDSVISALIENEIYSIICPKYIMSYTIFNRFSSNSFFNMYCFEDSRSASYAAIGICAEKNCPVVLLTNNGNDSRNCYSALTEAFYRKLPIIFITLNSDNYSLDYSQELNDVVKETIMINEGEVLDTSILNKQKKDLLPIHIILKTRNEILKKIEVDYLFNSHNTDDSYIFLGESISSNFLQKYTRNVAGGYDGIVSNILGASLSKKYNKYIGVCTECEFVRDMNALGNTNVSESMSFVIFGRNYIYNISGFVKELGFNMYFGRENFDKIFKDEKNIVVIDYDNGAF